MDKTINYLVALKSDTEATLEGVFRLGSPQDYEKKLEPIQVAILKKPAQFTITLKELSFLNSSGITSLARLIISARNQKVPITFIGNKSVAWQVKSLESLRQLWDKVTISFDT